MSKKLTSEKTTTVINGTEFRQQRHKAGKTLREIATESGISVSYLCDIELGRRSAKDAMARKLLAALDK